MLIKTNPMIIRDKYLWDPKIYEYILILWHNKNYFLMLWKYCKYEYSILKTKLYNHICEVFYEYNPNIILLY